MLEKRFISNTLLMSKKNKEIVRKNEIKSKSDVEPLMVDESKKKKKVFKPRGRTYFNVSTLYTIAIANIAIVTFGLHQIYYLYYVQPQLSVTKSDLPLVSYTSPENLLKWSTYRPHLYFGLRNRHPESPLFGLLWYEHPTERTLLYNTPVRHWCESSDSVKNYAWLFHDGKSYGKQKINDEKHQLNTSFISEGQSWSAHVSIKNTTKTAKRNVALIFYFASQDNKTLFIYDEKNKKIRGNSKNFDQFEIQFHSNNYIDQTFLFNSTIINPVYYKEYIMKNSKLVKEKQNFVLPTDKPIKEKTTPQKFFAVQFNFNISGDVYITYKSKSGSIYVGENYDEKLKEKANKFLINFEKKFNLNKRNASSAHKHMGRVALSNMLGGIGFFYGSNIVKSKYASSDYLLYYGPHSLFTAVPSRPFFPRGFLWDEAFHNILIRKFDPELSFEILGSWFDIINIEGWIPREMILGNEAQAKVPSEFIVQKDDVANPPAFFYLIDQFLHNLQFVNSHKESLLKLYPRLQLWYNWLKKSQSGPKKSLFRWRGRDDNVEKVLNPKTLASGLDDYPRASDPSEEEYHLDLRCWMALCSRVMRQLSEIVKSDQIDVIENLRKEENELNDYELLKKYHWSEESQSFADYGNHSMKVTLENELYRDHNGYLQYKWYRKLWKPAELRFVDDVFGYNSIFPFLLKQIPPKAPELKIILKKIGDPDILWSRYGLRSVAKNSPYYNKRNTEHDPPYWRGNIWININYMALSSLKYYADIKGPYQTMSLHLYEQLQSNVVSNIANEYKKTGFIWENYNDQTGAGQGTRPFNGWSSLVLAMLSGDFN
uniref:Mannosyl-oligosaccharide glucosidase n=2 Tax=Strongyloides stercoralis TaxID=6248 RepID=A0AAF5D2S6_STRER